MAFVDSVKCLWFHIQFSAALSVQKIVRCIFTQFHEWMEDIFGGSLWLNLCLCGSRLFLSHLTQLQSLNSFTFAAVKDGSIVVDVNQRIFLMMMVEQVLDLK